VAKIAVGWSGKEKETRGKTIFLRRVLYVGTSLLCQNLLSRKADVIRRGCKRIYKRLNKLSTLNAADKSRY